MLLGSWYKAAQSQNWTVKELFFLCHLFCWKPVLHMPESLLLNLRWPSSVSILISLSILMLIANGLGYWDLKKFRFEVKSSLYQWSCLGGCNQQWNLWNTAQGITKFLWACPGKTTPQEGCFQNVPGSCCAFFCLWMPCACCIWHDYYMKGYHCI